MTMKLFVTGEYSPYPEEWDALNEYSLVLAESPAQAIELSGQERAFEVDLSKPCVLLTMPDPYLHAGDDE